MSDEVGSASRGEEPMTKRKTEEESLPRRKPDAPHLPKIEIDFETLVAGDIAAVITKSPQTRRTPGPTQRDKQDRTITSRSSYLPQTHHRLA